MKDITRRSILAPIAGAFALAALSQALQTATRTYQRPKVTITDVRTAMVQAHGPQADIRIYTDRGLIGQGESTDAVVGTPALVQAFCRFLIGRDTLNVDAIWEQGDPAYRRNIRTI